MSRSSTGRWKADEMSLAGLGISPVWEAWISVDWSSAASKNTLNLPRKGGGMYTNPAAAAIRDEVTLKLRRAVQEAQNYTDQERVRVVQAKVWLAFYAEKDNHRGDAVNCIDLVCDAVKKAIPVDDRWFSVARLDWRVEKDRPQLILGVGQTDDCDHGVCSACGDVLPLLTGFHAKSRVCRACRKRS